MVPNTPALVSWWVVGGTVGVAAVAPGTKAETSSVGLSGESGRESLPGES